LARADLRPDAGIGYVLHGKKGKIKVGPDKRAAEYQAQKL
jgi:hypothetical protein